MHSSQLCPCNGTAHRIPQPTSFFIAAGPRPPSRGSNDPLIVNDALLNAWATPAAAAPALQKMSKAIAVRSLRRWDAFLGFRAGHDGLGRTLGVWRDKFDGVRFAVLLLAMRKLNEQLKLQHGAPGEQSL